MNHFMQSGISKKSSIKEKKKLCIDCGGFKPPEKSPRTKIRERELKRKMDKAEKKKKMNSSTN